MAGLYIHIPFCKTKCIYCDFYSMTSIKWADHYVNLLLRELKLRKLELGEDKLRTIYIGGGTPSLLSLAQLSKLIAGIEAIIDCGDVEEFTIEVNPDDVTLDYIKSVKAKGVNRVSMGIQSFNDEELKFLCRRHSAQDARNAVDAIRQGGIENVSVDLIYGIPKQTVETWERSIDNAIALNVNHISCYNLSYERGTRLYAMRESGKIHECDDDDCIAMYELLIKKMKKAGFDHYEISNFSKPGMYSCHNSNYWNLTKYIGLGVSAHSFDGENRRYNPNSLKDYLESLGKGELCCEIERETVWQCYNEAVMVMLRTKWGLDVAKIRHQFGAMLGSHLELSSKPFVAKGWLEQLDGRLKLTESGVMLSDMIIRELMYVE